MENTNTVEYREGSARHVLPSPYKEMHTTLFTRLNHNYLNIHV